MFNNENRFYPDNSKYAFCRIKRFSTLLAILLFNGGLFRIEIEKLSFCMLMASKRNFN